jgi:hypothetical protein
MLFFCNVIKILSNLFLSNAAYTIDETFNYLCKNRYVYAEKRFDVEVGHKQNFPILLSPNTKSLFLKRWLDTIIFRILFAYYGGKVCIKKGKDIFTIIPKKEIPKLTYFLLFPYKIIKWYLCARKFVKSIPNPIDVYNVKNVEKLRPEWEEMKERFKLYG